MVVQWRGRGRQFRIAALCVPCGGCNAQVGEECKPGWHTGGVDGVSGDRAATAEALGFITVDPGPLWSGKPAGSMDMHAGDNRSYAVEGRAMLRRNR